MTYKIELTEEDILHMYACRYADQRKEGYYNDVGPNLGTRLDQLSYAWVWTAHYEAFKEGYKTKLADTNTSSKIDEFRGVCYGRG
jgi:hypothetical protein